MADNELAFTPAWRLRERILQRELSAVELTTYFLGRVQRLNSTFNSFLTVCADQAVAQAKEADARLARKETPGPLHGIPIAIKDVTLTRGIRTTRGSLVFKDDVPEIDDIPVERIRAAGAIILGKTNAPEFGHLTTTENLLGDACRNPWNTACTVGGSSGGSASAIAAGLSPLAQGNDGAGSIRIPSSLCGIFGIRPSQGRVPRLYASPGGWSTFVQNGPLTRTVRDAIMLLQVMAGPDPRDPTAMHESPPDFSKALDGNVRGLRIAWSPDYGGVPVEPEVLAAVKSATEVFEQLGARVEEANPPVDTERLLDLFNTFLYSDYLVWFGSLLETHADLLMPTFREPLAAARDWRGDRVAAALHELEWHRYRMARFFDGYDLLLSPTLATVAFPINEYPRTIAGRSVKDPVWAFTPFTYAINMAGQTAVSVPCGFSPSGLPIGLHIAGPQGAEVKVLRAAAAFEKARPWAQHRPRTALIT